MRILVTGANGLLGSNLVDTLAKDKNNLIYALDKRMITNIPRLNNVHYLTYDLKYSYYEQYLALPNVDIIYHLAAYNGTKHFYKEPYKVIKDNILSTINIIDYYNIMNLKPLIIYAGTPESRTSAKLPIKESAPYVTEDPFNPRWSYANSKALGEQAVINSGFPFIIVIPYNIYGPLQKDHFIPEFIERANKGKYEIYGGNNTRSFLYINDFIEAIIKLSKIESAQGQVFNIGNDKETRIIDVAYTILKLMNIKETIKVFDAPTGSVSRRKPDISKIKKAIDWEPTTILEEGLAEVVRYLTCV